MFLGCLEQLAIAPSCEMKPMRLCTQGTYLNKHYREKWICVFVYLVIQNAVFSAIFEIKCSLTAKPSIFDPIVCICIFGKLCIWGFRKSGSKSIFDIPWRVRISVTPWHRSVTLIWFGVISDPTYPTYDLSKAEICNKNFWIGNDPPPRLELFQKFIRFGIGRLP